MCTASCAHQLQFLNKTHLVLMYTYIYAIHSETEVETHIKVRLVR